MHPIPTNLSSTAVNINFTQLWALARYATNYIYNDTFQTAHCDHDLTYHIVKVHNIHLTLSSLFYLEKQKKII